MLLDFEKPIVELDEKIADMKSLAEQSGVDVSDAIKALEEKLQKLKKETYSNLTRWQRVQLSRHQDRPYTLDYIYELTDDFVELDESGAPVGTVDKGKAGSKKIKKRSKAELKQT